MFDKKDEIDFIQAPLFWQDNLLCNCMAPSTLTGNHD